MTLRARFLLVACGVIIFLVAAPLAIFFARGYYFDFANKRIIKTGTLVVKTDPRGAQVFLGERLTGSASLVKRFIIPGEYVVHIKKSGYRPWKKRIVIHEQTVTYLPFERPEKIPLFLEEPIQTTLSTSTAEDLEPEFTDPDLQKKYAISPDKKRLKFTDEAGQETDILNQDLPAFRAAKIIISPEKQIFLLLDDILYEVADKLESINENVTRAFWDKTADVLLYGNDHEIWIYDPRVGIRNQLALRTSEKITAAVYNKTTNYIFAAIDGELRAIEFDQIYSQPNVYALAAANQPLPKLSINKEGNELIYAEGASLVSLKIR